MLAEVVRQRETTGGARIAVLRARLGMSHSSLRRVLDDLVEERGWLARNPGYGHPLRPELVLEIPVLATARWAGLYYAQARHLDVERVAFRKWAAAALLAAGRRRDGSRFSELKEDLDGITARGLTLVLKDLLLSGLLERDLRDEFPPAAIYRLSPTGRRLAAVAAKLPVVGGPTRS